MPSLAPFRVRVGWWIHRYASLIAGEPFPVTRNRPTYQYATDTWIYPIAFTSAYAQMARQGFVGITQLVQQPGTENWTLEVRELPVQHWHTTRSGS